MNRIDLLKKNYQRLCEFSWDRNVAGAQRVWIAVYDKEDERKLRLRLGLFEEVTLQSGHKWVAIDVTDSFASWLSDSPYARFAESYFQSTSRLGAGPLAAFLKFLSARLAAELASPHVREDTVVALFGVASLFGFVHVSDLLPLLEAHIRGRLLIFFPGVYEQNNYRLLDARDGWNYLAVPITASEAEVRP